jgi:sec-independent protein translocase protein TatC
VGKKNIKSKDANDLTFLEHLEVLRGHIIRSAISVLIFTVAAFMIKDFLFNIVLLAPKEPNFITNRLFCQLGELINSSRLCINSEGLDIINIDLAGQFKIHLRIAFFAGLILSSPYIFTEVFRFVLPALKDVEKKYSAGMVFYTTALFLTGVLFGYYLIIPLTINFLGGYSVSAEVANQIALKSYIGSITSLSLSTGLAFELPIMIYFLSKVGLVTPDFMRKYRKHALVVFLVLSGIITPPDVFSQVMVVIPLLLLYELSIVIAKRVQKDKEKNLAG